ncbi:MAG TPA: FAD-binding oxidoreductase [Bryobacteraceae bacterium]|nr:FAD-binding oxidoreductase [Bryobacteraceae bacterium]
MPADHSAFRSGIRGEVLEPRDAGYHDARKLYNAMIEKRPALIARCADAADVMTSVNYARDNGLLLAVRGGGHSAPGLGGCDDGLVIDLSRMRGVRVSPDARVADVAGGCVWGDVDHATHPFGLAAPAGFVSTTGVGGLTLGGGIGYLTRKYGLTIDSLLAVDVVLADGSFVTASEKQNADLFWAVRGGGGNFGVVTNFTFALHPVRVMTAGPMFWAIEHAPEIMRRWEELIARLPDELSGFFAFLTVPPAPMFPAELHLRTVCGVIWSSAADQATVDGLLEPVASWPKPLLSHVGPMPLPFLNSLFDPLYPAGLQSYWKADFVNTLSDEAIARHFEFGSKPPTMLSTMHLYPIDGAVHRVAPDATAFAYRKTRFAEVILAVDPDPANKDKISDWARAYWDAVHPFAAPGGYVNFMMEEGASRVEATYGANFARLRKVKKAYDPGNLFRVNQNIPPAG